MTADTANSLGIYVRLDSGFEDALARTIAALKVEGFGVLTEIDVQDTFKKKLGVDHPPYKSWAPATRPCLTAP